MSRFFETVNDAMLADRFLFLGAGTRRAVAFGTRNDIPFFSKIGIVRRFLGPTIIFRSHRFMAGMLPICLGYSIPAAPITPRTLRAWCLTPLTCRYSQSPAAIP